MATATTPAGHTGSVKAAAWGILLGAGGISVTYNVYHALHGGQVKPALAYLLGIGPVFVAMCLSHIVAEYRGGKVIKGLAFAVMGGAMGQSIGAIVAVVRPADGPWMGALFGCVLDAASLIALFILLQSRGGKVAEATARDAAEARAGQAAARAVTLDADLSATREELTAAAAERDAVRSELAAARAEVQGLRSGLNQRRGSGRKPARSSGSGSGRGSGPAKPAGSGPNPEEPADIDTQAEALSIYLADREISGSELGRRLGKSESYGCRLKRELAKSVADPEGSQP